MTSYARPSVHACPGCDAFFLRPRLRSVNYYGAVDWSDGTPTMYWHREPLARCMACAALFWLDEIEAVGILPEKPYPIGRLSRAWMRWRGDPQQLLSEEQEWLRTPDGWKRATTIGSVGFDDVVHVLSRSRQVSPEQLLWLRTRVWWGLNDRYRTRADGSPLLDVPSWPRSVERTNMEVMLDLLQAHGMQPWSMVRQGELLRLLGRFDEAVAVLRAVPADGHSEIRAAKIERLARGRDAQVRLLSERTW